MNIALFHNLSSGGARRHTFEQIRELTVRGHVVDEYAPSTADLKANSLDAYTRQQFIYPLDLIDLQKRRIPFVTPYLHYLNLHKYYRYLDSVYAKIACDIDEHRYDVVLVKDCQFTGNPSILKFLRTPSLYQCHHGLNFSITNKSRTNFNEKSLETKAKEIFYYPIRWASKRLIFFNEVRNIQSANRIITNSNYSRYLIKKYYQLDSTVIYPGINSQIFRPLDLRRENLVLSVGGLNYKKGFDFLIDALNVIDEKIRPEFLIVSNVIDNIYKDSLIESAKQKRVKLSVKTIRDDNELVNIYNRAALFIYAPYNEALGMAPLEALACGLPVVGVCEGGVIETLAGCPSAKLIERNTDLFAKAILDMMQTDNFPELSKSAIAFIKDRWTWERAIDQLTDELLKTKTDG